MPDPHAKFHQNRLTGFRENHGQRGQTTEEAISSIQNFDPSDSTASLKCTWVGLEMNLGNDYPSSPVSHVG